MTASETTLVAADPPLREQIGDATAVLFEVPAHAACGTAGCVDLLGLDGGAAIDLLCVTLAASPDACLDAWREHVGGDRLGRTWFVTADAYARSAASGGTVASPDGSLRIETVPSPGNLTRLGVRTTDLLRAHATADDRRPLAVCVDSLGTLLQFAGTELVFQFLHTLTGQVENANAVGHYHLDPTAHDERTVRTLETLFDAIVAYDGGWTMRTR